MKFIKIFEPLKIGSFTIRNRLVMPAMHLNFSDDGSMNEMEINFYRERAKGGAGLIIIGGCAVEMRGGAPGMIRIDNDKYIPGLSEFTRTVHEFGAKTVAQLYHAGRYAFSFVSGEQPISASAVYSKFSRETPREMTKEDIEEVIGKHADAAVRAKKSGFDGVELLGSAGYLINQFLSPITNKRTDEYGGSFENRMRFPLELIEAVRNAVGDGFTVGIRVSGDDFMPGGNTFKENTMVALKYAEAGIDYINVTGGWHETRIPQITSDVPPGAYVYLAENIKRGLEKIGIDVPVFAGNRINDPVLAENILRDERADAVSMGRAFIADPYFPQKVKEGKLWDIVKCVACNRGCFDHIFLMKPVECMRNFLVSREGKYDLSEKVKEPKRVVIVGAGPAGLEAARVATLRGHSVVVLEEKEEIGGQLRVACVPPGREAIADIIEYYKNQIRHLGIEVKTGTKATPELIESYNPDAVILATGVEFNIPNIEGIDGSLGSDIVFADIALAGDHPVGRKVVVVGGAATGVETAIWAARKGAMDPATACFLMHYRALPYEEIEKRCLKGPREVIILEMLPKIGTSIGRSTRWVLLDELKHLGIEVITEANITKFENDKVYFERKGEPRVIKGVDTFILATGVKPNRKLYNLLKERKPPYKITRIGDCKKPRTIMEAIHEGFKAAYKL